MVVDRDQRWLEVGGLQEESRREMESWELETIYTQEIESGRPANAEDNGVIPDEGQSGNCKRNGRNQLEAGGEEYGLLLGLSRKIPVSRRLFERSRALYQLHIRTPKTITQFLYTMFSH